MASLRHFYNYLTASICCCGCYEEPESLEKPQDMVHHISIVPQRSPACTERPKTVVIHSLASRESFTSPDATSTPNRTTSSPHSVIITTPEAENCPRKVSGMARFSRLDEPDDSLVSEDAPSDFSRLARKPDPVQDNTTTVSGTPRRTLASMSIAKLTSGVADGDWRSR